MGFVTIMISFMVFQEVFPLERRQVFKSTLGPGYIVHKCGETLRMVKTKDAMVCSQICMDTPKCTAFVQKKDDCFIKSACAKRAKWYEEANSIVFYKSKFSNLVNIRL